jgi:hypothetical protein
MPFCSVTASFFASNLSAFLFRVRGLPRFVCCQRLLLSVGELLHQEALRAMERTTAVSSTTNGQLIGEECVLE